MTAQEWFEEHGDAITAALDDLATVPETSLNLAGDNTTATSARQFEQTGQHLLAMGLKRGWVG